MVERPLSMREVPGSIPGISKLFFHQKKYFLAVRILNDWHFFQKGIFVEKISFFKHHNYILKHKMTISRAKDHLEIFLLKWFFHGPDFSKKSWLRVRSFGLSRSIGRKLDEHYFWKILEKFFKKLSTYMFSNSNISTISMEISVAPMSEFV